MRSANMQALTNDLIKRYPGVTIYGIGDADHKLNYSDHNEDDTPGSKSAQTDADNIPEHRAIDVMLGRSFTKVEATGLVARLVGDPTSRRRLFYVIWDHHIWSRDNDWNPAAYNGDSPHTDHVHISGIASDDGNASTWPVVFGAVGSGPTPPRLRRQWPSFMGMNDFFGLLSGGIHSHGGYYIRERDDIKAIQSRLTSMGYKPGAADGYFGPKTAAAVSSWQHALWSNQTTLYGQIWRDDWDRLFTY